MDMIDIGFKYKKRQIMLLTTFCNQLFRFPLNPSNKDISPVFGYPNQMVPNLIAAPPGFTHL
jgi:hypothetical protein